MVSKNNNIFCFISRLVLLLLFLPGYYNKAQDIPASSVGNLTFYLDHASFSATENNTYVEFYLMFYEDQLTKLRKNDSWIAEIKLESVIENLNDEYRTKKEWFTEIELGEENSSVFGKVIYDLWSENLSPGNYSVKINATDNLGSSGGEINTHVNIRYISNSQWGVSDIEFVTSAELTEMNNHFKKGKLKVLPNPSRRFGLLNPKLYFYYEVYGIPENAGDLIAEYRILDNNKVVVKKLLNIAIKKTGISAAILHGIDVNELKTGNYELNIRITDQTHLKELKVSRMFEIIQADFFQTKNLLTEEQAEIFQTVLSYIGTPQHLNLYKSLNLTGKAEFMVQYWKNLDPDPNTPENEFLIEIQKRFNHAKNKYGWYNANGWETDRGRICIKYGIPHQITQYNTEANTAPYEVWIYNENRTYEFIFADPRSNGRYILLHSNREGEIYNGNWREAIQRM